MNRKYIFLTLFLNIFLSFQIQAEELTFIADEIVTVITQEKMPKKTNYIQSPFSDLSDLTIDHGQRILSHTKDREYLKSLGHGKWGREKEFMRQDVFMTQLKGVFIDWNNENEFDVYVLCWPVQDKHFCFLNDYNIFPLPKEKRKSYALAMTFEQEVNAKQLSMLVPFSQVKRMAEEGILSTGQGIQSIGSHDPSYDSRHYLFNVGHYFRYRLQVLGCDQTSICSFYRGSDLVANAYLLSLNDYPRFDVKFHRNIKMGELKIIASVLEKRLSSAQSDIKRNNQNIGDTNEVKALITLLQESRRELYSLPNKLREDLAKIDRQEVYCEDVEKRNIENEIDQIVRDTENADLEIKELEEKIKNKRQTRQDLNEKKDQKEREFNDRENEYNRCVKKKMAERELSRQAAEPSHPSIPVEREVIPSPSKKRSTGGGGYMNRVRKDFDDEENKSGSFQRQGKRPEPPSTSEKAPNSGSNPELEWKGKKKKRSGESGTYGSSVKKSFDNPGVKSGSFQKQGKKVK
jgi:hypothetical protein